MKSFKIKKVVLATLVSGSLICSPLVQAGGIPTFDGVAVGHAIQQGIQLKTQIENQISQLKELQSQAKALTGSRNVGQLLSNALDMADKAGKLGDEWTSLYGKMKPTGKITQDLNGKGYSREASLKQILNNQDFNIKALEAAQKRLTEIVKLGQQVSRTQDMKAAADFANRIAVEQAYVQAMQVKLDMAARIAANQKEIQQQRYQNQQACMAKHIRDGNYKACL